jgi:acyl-CoA synthetase (AMP-forming)/AMP-acid ligase II
VRTAVRAPGPPVTTDPPFASLARLIGDRAAGLGHHTYLVHARHDRRVSYRGLNRAVAGWAARWDECGVAPGATVAIAVADPVDFATVFLAVIASGRWAAPLDPGAGPDGPGGAATAAGRLGADHVVADHRAPAGCALGWTHDLDQKGGPPRPPRPTFTPGPDPGGVLLSSSGTTGVPKVIALGQDQLLQAAGNVSSHHGLTAGDRGFNPLPLFHINGEVVGLLASLVAGAELVVDDRFHRTRFWELMGRHEVTWINAVPAIISRLIPLRVGEAVPAGVRFIRSASAPLPVATLRRFEEATGIGVLETYGMTEAASQITANPVAGTRKPGSVGRPVGVELRIVPDDPIPDDPVAGDPIRGDTIAGDPIRGDPVAGDPIPGGRPSVARGPVGRVEIRGPSVITAYRHGHHADLVDDEGWLRTGDLGHLDDDGYLYLAGRGDDVINRGGEKVFPREIEEVILGDPAVAAVAVVGESDAVFGQVPMAFVVLHAGICTPGPAGADPVARRIRARLEAQLVRSKRPRELRIVADLPVGATGKVQRRLLGERSGPVVHRLACR